MVTTYLAKDKRSPLGIKKKRTSWNQSLKAKPNLVSKKIKIKKSLQHTLLLRKFSSSIDFKNIRLLKAFLTKNGKIRPRRKTRISVQYQRAIAKSIRKARAFGLIPFSIDVKL